MTFYLDPCVDVTPLEMVLAGMGKQRREPCGGWAGFWPTSNRSCAA